ncbi:hypothetical protein FACS1894201_09820 [Bacteroidia bacterium]|nr:hypothetical protein FACS1894201_09820 [Bacteroidia bacterium]
MKGLVKKIIGLAIIVVAVWLCLKFSVFQNFQNPFKSKPIVIDKTVNVVEKIRRLADFTTATYYKDYVIVQKKLSDVDVLGIKIALLGNKMTTQDELVLVTKGKVRAGFDLSKMQEQDITVDSISIMLKLPEPQLLEVITNPSDFETFEETGKWSHEEVTGYKNAARAAIENEALENGILERAEKAGKEKLTTFLHALGFKKISIIVAKREE